MDLEDGFFDDIQEEKHNRDEQKPLQPALRKKRWGKIIGKIFACVLAAGFVFLSGMLTTWLVLDEEVRTLIKIKKTIDKEYYKDVSDEEFYGVLFAAINEDLLDPYSEYMTGEEYGTTEENLAGRHNGIGIVVSTKNDKGENQILISRVVENSPAEEAELCVQDYIIGYGKSETEIVDSVDFENGLDPFLQTIADGEYFYLKILRGEEEKLIRICRRHYVESYVQYRTKTTSYGFTGEDALQFTRQDKPLAVLDEKTAYIRLSQFTGNAAHGFERVMTQFKTDGMQNLVLDLRGNGGGYLEYLCYIARYFCKNSTEARPVVTVADYGEKQEYYRASGNVYREYFGEESRIVVLADVGTASASECLIGCMLDYGAITYEDICLSERSGGTRTYGKGIMQTTFYLDMEKDDVIKLTTAELRWPISGHSIHMRGVLPTDGTKTTAGNYNGDEELIAAIETLFSGD
ncbi:MAG: hypothetical protein IJV83_00565 [Clostridia bacterium]|nr:hypothetical protein [Clostridia bacterium]